MTDLDVMERIAAGDSSSLAILYDRHSAMVLAVCLGVLGNRTEAEEVLADVFWAVWKLSSRYDPLRGSPVSWLLTLARSRAIDKLRSVARRQEVSLPSGDTQTFGAGIEPSGAPAGPFEAAALAQSREHIRAALANLKAPQRRAVELSFYQGLSHSEIAESLGQPLGTVKTWIRQGLLRMREALGPQLGRGTAA